MRIKVEASAGLSDTLISIGRPFSRWIFLWLSEGQESKARSKLHA